MKTVNRELSWLAFNHRVLQEAQDASVPLIERLRFLGIFSNNLDEFFRVRVATVKRMITSGIKRKETDDLKYKPKELLKEIHATIILQQAEFSKAFHAITDELRREKIFFISEKDVTEEQKQTLWTIFKEQVMPHITPLILQNDLPFPHLRDKSIYLAVKMARKNSSIKQYALIEIPTDFISRFIVLPATSKGTCVMLLDDVIRLFLDKIFYVFSYTSIEAHTTKLTRDAELDLDSDLSKSLIDTLSHTVKQRKKGAPVRFIYDKEISDDLLQYILKRAGIPQENLVSSGRYHNFKDFISFPKIGKKELIYEPIKPIAKKEFEKTNAVFSVLDKQDVLAHYPYHSFNYFIDFLHEASIDPQVKEIKMTMYRLAKNSQVANTLINAVKNGKKVTAVVELQARFDEEANIYWAKTMQEEGVKVIYGASGLKTHAKLCVVTKEIRKKPKHYAVISTGNFNEVSSKIYSDTALYTANQDICKEALEVIEFVQNRYKYKPLKHLITSPYTTRKAFEKLIDEEIKHAKAGRKACIKIKLNSLSSYDMVYKLYEASEAGVKVQLIIRGICCLIPKQKKYSENIEAVSIIDKFLEHSRMFIFHNNGNEKVFISSADWMTRNLDNRIEVTCPIYEEKLQKEIIRFFDTQWKDNVKSRILNSKNNMYETSKGKPYKAQEMLYELFKKMR